MADINSLLSQLETIEKPKFKSCFHVEIVESVGVFLLSESEHHVLEGRTYELLAPLMKGELTENEIADRLKGEVDAREVFYALMRMRQQGYIVEAEDDLPPEQGSLYALLKVEPKVAQEKLREKKISCTALGKAEVEPFIKILESLGIQIAEVAEEADLTVVLTDDYLQEGLAEFNQKAIESKRPWMLVKPVGTTVWIGPIFKPGETGCWECLARRLRDNKPVDRFVQKHKSSSAPFATVGSPLISTLQTGLNLAATEIFKWIAEGENELLEGKLLSFDFREAKAESHVAVKRPQCPICGDPKYWHHNDPSPIVLESRKKAFTDDGGHRSLSPEATLDKYDHHISPITGAVRHLIPIINDGIYSYVAGHNFASMFDSLFFLRRNVRGRSGGKGKTEIQAKASALGEAIERYSGVFQGYETRRTATYKELGAAAIHPHDFLNFSEEQYKTRETWNVECTNHFQKVAERFDAEAEATEIEWTPLWSLTKQEFKYLPTAYCYYGYSKLPKAYCWANSNGCAAGNSLEEAILQGFMEVVERDSVALWWYNRIKRPAVDLASFNEPYFLSLQEYYRNVDREIWVLDITSDLGIPVFAAISRRTDGKSEDIVYAFGAHLDPKIAVQRALTEANQLLPSVLKANSDEAKESKGTDELIISWRQKATVANQPYLKPDEGQVKVYADYPQLASDDLRDDVMTCVEIAAKEGLEVLVLDQTRPDIGLNVVKVLIPGMRIFWKRLGPGRLYDVPVKMGWLSEPLEENQLNPIPIFI
ncbi:MAG: TOMM precursor leader peptide-binding protein [Oscillatoria sp. SIO1A7]|nr:TOMM precursor leader peptide-binding protein [Oscillatoria sp. SIO1A7]